MICQATLPVLKIRNSGTGQDCLLFHETSDEKTGENLKADQHVDGTIPAL
jgi:hypothetical protein